MSSYRKLLFIISIGLFGFAGLIHAQNQPLYYNNTSAWSGAAEICHLIPAISGNPTLGMYGIHATNSSAAVVYLAVFPNTAAQPSNGVVIPGGGWTIQVHNDVDVNTVLYGISNAGGSLEACLSTTQGTFTAATAVGYFWVLYQGTAATPTATSTPSPTPT